MKGLTEVKAEQSPVLLAILQTYYITTLQPPGKFPRKK